MRDGHSSGRIFAGQKNIWRCETLHRPVCRSNYRAGTIGGETSMPRSHTPSQRSDAICPKPLSSATQVAILLAIAVAAIFVVDWALEASRSRSATSTAVPISAAGTARNWPRRSTVKGRRACAGDGRPARYEAVAQWTRERAARGMPAISGRRYRGALQDQYLWQANTRPAAAARTELSRSPRDFGEHARSVAAPDDFCRIRRYTAGPGHRNTGLAMLRSFASSLPCWAR